MKIKSDPNQNKYLLILKLLGFIVGLIIIATIFWFIYIKYETPKLGVRAVEDMYTFTSYSELVKNDMPDLQKITTPQVYNKLAYTNQERALTTYMKFAGKPTSVNILASTDEYVVFSINSPAINPNRKFIMFYNVNLFGNISEVHESELYNMYINDKGY